MRLPILFFILVILPFSGERLIAARVEARSNTPQNTTGFGTIPRNPPETKRMASATAEEYLSEASRAMAQGRWREAAEAYTSFTLDFSRPETEPVIARFQPALAFCLIRLHRYSDALVPLQKALNQHPPFPAHIHTALLLQSGLCEWHQGHFARAREYLSLFLSVASPEPAFQQAHLLVAQSYLIEGTPAMAAECLQQCRPLLDQEHAAQALSLEINALLESSQHEKALALAEKQAQALESSLEALAFQRSLLKMGSIFLDRGSFRQALQCLRRVRSWQKILNFGETQLAWLNKNEGRPNKESESDLNSAIPQNREKLQKEIEAIRRCPNWDILVAIQLAGAYNGLQHLRESAILLTHAIETNPPDPLLEQAGVMMVQNWYALECWSKVQTAANLFEQKYPRSSHVQLTHFFKGMALQKENQFEEALKTFRAVITDNPKSETGTRARFMLAFTELLAGESTKASGLFLDLIQQKPRHEIAEEASAWLCVSHALAKQHQQCLSASASYKKRYPEGENRPLVIFQESRCMLALGDFEAAVAGFRAFLNDFSDHSRAGEARLLLADALTTTGKTEAALEILESIPPSDPSTFEEAWFRITKHLIASNSVQHIVSHLERFKKSRPQSARFGSAALETAKALQSCGHSEEAHKIVWNVINTFLNDPKISAVEVLLEAIPGLFHHGATENERTASLRALFEQALKTGDSVGLVRSQWALFSALRQTHSYEARKGLLEALPNLDPETSSDRILAAFSQACTEEGRHSEGAALWTALLKWNPRSIYKDRVLTSWISDSLQAGDPSKALAIIQRMESECPDSPLRAKAILEKASIQEQMGESMASKQTLEGLLSERQVPAEYKSEALLRLAECEMQQGNPRRALPFYQRIYVLYGRHKPQLAKAYIRSAKAFEQIGDTKAAMRTYREFLAADIPDEYEEKALAQQNLARLEAVQ
jgi:tetratricopeptide (TPR) repeat protein